MTLKAAGAEAAITSTVVAAATKDAEEKAKGQQVDEAKVKAAGVVAAERAAALLPVNLENELPGAFGRTLSSVSGGALGGSVDDAAARAAEETVAEASQAALDQVP